ncbi:type II/IV secretion system protein [Candidatus Berkelbacteria bacterium]|nr:type II/IV secretion system protein [Candidatus Berkelbacteria bacterium]
MALSEAQIEKALLGGNYIKPDALKSAQQQAKARKSTTIEYLISENLVSRQVIGEAIASSLNTKFIDLSNFSFSPELVKFVPAKLAVELRFITVKNEQENVIVVSDDPQSSELLKQLPQLFPQKNIYVYYCLPDDLTNALEQYHQPLETRFSKIIAGKNRIAPEIIEEIITDALHFKTSDIHFEPRSKEVIVRFRVDGVLQEAGRIPKTHYENILNHIKVLSRLRIDEHFSAQDGSMSFIKGEIKVDLRISIIPTVEGEKIAIRVLSAYVQGLSLTDIGLSDIGLTVMNKEIKKPFGMILVAGPTGSGKTTTLYALLKLVNSPEVNVTTIEDPVEYKLEGINQIQINQLTNLTFAQGLKSIVRQDPDIILVGEIRDQETAEIAVNAALTGHLLLTTFHANDAATAVTRLLEMGIEPFLLASTLETVVAQRLVRKICTRCRIKVDIANQVTATNKILIDRYFNAATDSFYEGKGCEVCGHTGFNGRTAIFEIIRITPALEEKILDSPSSTEVWELARSEGSISLFDDGVQKVKEGITTLTELIRVAEPPSEELKAAIKQTKKKDAENQTV